MMYVNCDRQVGTRYYDWDLTIDIIKKEYETFLMMFSMPIDELIPDVRLDDFSDQSMKIYQHELKLIAPYANGDNHKDLITLITNHIQTLKEASNVHIEPNQVILDINDHHISFMGIGYYQRHVTLEERMHHIMTHFHEDETPKRRIFNIRRDISQHLLHHAIGDMMTIQFRVTGIAAIKEGMLSIEYIKVSLPFNIVLEEKK